MYSIQYLRAFAAYLVVAFHISASLNSETGSSAVFAVGSIGVDVFFVLSGFLMAMLVAERRDINGRFLLRRFIRIAPLYYLVTLTLVAVALIAPLWLNTSKFDPWHLLASLLFVPYAQANGALTPILGLGWTLNYEMFFYILVAATTFVFGDRSLRSNVIFLLLLVTAGRAVDLGPIWRFYTDPILLEFAAGILIYHYIWCDMRPRNSAIFVVVFAGGLMAMALDPLGFPGDHRLFTWGFPAILIVTGGIFALNFRTEWLKRLGDWSYSTYLIHVYIVQLAVKSLVATGLAGAVNPVALILAVVPVTVVASAYLYHFFEMPIMRKLEALTGLRGKLRRKLIGSTPALMPDLSHPLAPSNTKRPGMNAGAAE